MKQSPIDFLETLPHNSFNKYSMISNLPFCFFISTRRLINRRVKSTSTSSALKRSAPINFEFVRHSERFPTTALTEECCFLISAVCCFNSSLFPLLVRNWRLKNYPDPWQNSDPKLIGVICYSASSDGDRRRRRYEKPYRCGGH